LSCPFITHQSSFTSHHSPTRLMDEAKKGPQSQTNEKTPFSSNGIVLPTIHNK